MENDCFWAKNGTITDFEKLLLQPNLHTILKAIVFFVLMEDEVKNFWANSFWDIGFMQI